MLGGDEPLRGDREGGFLFPVAMELTGVLVEEQHAGQVGSVGGHARALVRQVARKQQVTQPVPGKHLVAKPHDHGRDLVHRLDQRDDAGSDPRRTSMPAAQPAGRTGQVVEVRALVVVELERARQGIDDRLGRIRRLPLLEPGVVRERDPCQLRELLAPEARDPALPDRWACPPAPA